MKLTNWLNQSVKLILVSAALINVWQGNAQTGLVKQPVDLLNHEKVQQLARANYPLIKRKALLQQTADLNISNLSRSYLPQFVVNGQATYQSDVTRVDVPLPNIKIDAPERDQYKIYAEGSQLIYDGGQVKAQKQLQSKTADVDNLQVEVELYKLRQRVSNIYLGIIYLDEQLKQSQLIIADLNTGIKKLQAQVNNGVAFRSNLNMLKAELLRSEQRVVELDASREGLISNLSLFINEPISPDVVFQRPPVALTDANDGATQPAAAVGSSNVQNFGLRRPELLHLKQQSELLGLQENLIRARNKPKASFFIQGGYGRPALNLLKNQFDWYYIGGIRLNWNLGGLYTANKEKQIIAINQRNLDLQAETFILNTRAEIVTQQAEISRLKKMISIDDGIIDLRNQVRDASKAQLENGVISAADYLREINAADRAVQDKILHEIQLMQARINYAQTMGTYQ